MRLYRFPTKEAREKMTVTELEEAYEGYMSWILMFEEHMTFAESDKMMKKADEFEGYIRLRGGKIAE